MAAVTVAFDGTRVGNSDAITGWTAEGATPTAETDYYYQGSGSVSVQVKTAEVGTYFTAGATADFSTNNMVWIAKVIQTNKDAIDGLGLQLKIGSANSAAYRYEIFSATTYPTTGGWQIVCINPNITQWRTATIGTPDLTAVDTYGIRSDAAFTAKAPNLGIDAIDIINNGTGLTLTRGDGGDADGTFTSFVTSDEGTQDNRWGVVQTRGGIVYVNGTLQIGNSTVNTAFTDSNRVVVFPDHRVSNNFCGMKFDCSNTGSSYALTTCIFNGRGALYTSDDTRPSYFVTGAAGALNITGCTFNVFNEMNLASTSLLSGTSLIAGRRVNQNGANVYQCSVSGAATSPNVAFLVANNPGRISGCDFTFNATAGGHAIEITATGTYSFNGNLFTGYGANASSNAAIYNNSGGLVTLNVSGGDSPTVRNGTSATTVVQSSAVLTLSGIQTNSEVRIYQYNSQDNLIEHTGYFLAGADSVNGYLQSATIVSGGTGYTVSDTLTISGGTGTAATLTVSSVSGGVITGVTVASNGEYTANPTAPASVTGGTGSGATFNLDISGGFEYSYSDAGSQIDIIVFHLDYKPERFSQYTLPSSNSGIIVRQVADRVYFNG